MSSRKEEVALELLQMSRNQLLIYTKFLSLPISYLKIKPYEGSIGVDGTTLYYDISYLFRCFKENKNSITRDYLHSVLHCIFLHFKVSTIIDQRRWNIACDITIENMISELNLTITTLPLQSKQESVINKFKKKCKKMTAEFIYHELLDASYDAQLKSFEQLFCRDDHSLWYKRTEQQEEDSSNQDDSDASNDDSSNQDGNQQSEFGTQELEKLWKEVAEQLQVELETFAKKQGNEAGSLMQNLNEVTREQYDYGAFLKKFAVLGEVMKVNDDEFDYNFYTYGLNMNYKVALIEPLEYKEEKRIKEFVIAIDTSGSVYGELVEAFVRKTYNILKNSESYFSKVKIYIIQCDTTIQEIAIITSMEELENYIKTMTLKGFGGTDFRPVFNYVDTLIEDKVFKNLKGLLYFTDGYGDFPRKKPKYETAVVYLENDDYNQDVPMWAIKLILRANDIEN